MVHIRLDNLSLAFPVLHGSSRSLKKSLLGKAKAAVGGEMAVGSDVVMVRALSSLTFEIAGGERIGLVGHNGAGKSTLLRVLAGIYETSEGRLDIDGDSHALIDPQSGMNPELTGRENLRLFACRLGVPKSGLAALEADVQAFAELGPFFDLPVRLYSSGMGIRLGFALATVPRPRILLMDEWFLAGDQHFQDKAKARLAGMVHAAEILVVTSHSLRILREWCTRILWMEHGQVRLDGPTDAVLDAYEASLRG